jgi:hypothetical protein
LSKLDGFSLPDSSFDTWVWNLEEGGDIFIVKNVRFFIDSCLLPTGFRATIWNRNIPKKVNIHVWRLLQDRLPTRDRLSRLGMDVPSSLCPCCDSSLEDSHHLFVNCLMASDLWRSITGWLDISHLDFTCSASLFDSVGSATLNLKKKCLVEGIIMAAWWVIWRFRNAKVFNRSAPNKSFLFDDVQLFAFDWFVHRRSKYRMSWLDWLFNPLMYV